jgi:Zn-dependent M28 family amino/carboxypeptidase
VSAFLMIDIALSGIVPGAYDNASGVAAVLSAAEELDSDPPENLDVWVVLAGAEESLCEGMRSFVRAHGEELDEDRTVFVNVDSVSHGDVTYEVSEGPVVSYPLDQQLVEGAAALGEDPRFNARPLRYPLLDDALPARLRGYRAITIRTTEDGLPAPWYHTEADTPDRVDSAALTRATEFIVGLCRLADRDFGRSTA